MSEHDESWVDRHGDVWRLGADGLMHTPETAPFPREHVERKWGPLRLVQPPQPAENGAGPHPHIEAVRAYLDNAGITPETLRYAATHEALCRSWIFDLLTGLADTMEADTRVLPSGKTQP